MERETVLPPILLLPQISDLKAQSTPDSEAESHPQPDPEAASDVDEIDVDSGAIVSVKVELKGGLRPFYCAFLCR